MKALRISSVEAAVYPAATVLLSMAFVLIEPICRAMRSFRLLGSGASLGPVVVSLLLVLALYALLRRADAARACRVIALFGAAILLDSLSPVRVPQLGVIPIELECMIAAVLVVLAVWQMSRMQYTPVVLRCGYCLAGALILSVFIFNGRNQYEEMHILGGGSVV